MPVLVVLGLLAATTLLGVAPADAAGCHFVDGTFVDSGASSARVWLDYCPDGSYRVSGTLWDDACDDRTAYLDIHAGSGGVDTTQVTGCGNRRTFAYSYGGDLTYVSLRTKARNRTASPSDWGYVYA